MNVRASRTGRTGQGANAFGVDRIAVGRPGMSGIEKKGGTIRGRRLGVEHPDNIVIYRIDVLQHVEGGQGGRREINGDPHDQMSVLVDAYKGVKRVDATDTRTTDVNTSTLPQQGRLHGGTEGKVPKST